ncbi:hypothetical protein [Streptomyces marincola]|uniref:hypothetical protein n=1 Tax=Streptomyces marincola TaxID=2878388 RepID=UPI001CF4CD5F|nr:hypothetical protein [Streptomyces marincola]UCM90374.1 hypothetical protein LC193_21925 [Streptomyces marincola]
MSGSIPGGTPRDGRGNGGAPGGAAGARRPGHAPDDRPSEDGMPENSAPENSRPENSTPGNSTSEDGASRDRTPEDRTPKDKLPRADSALDADGRLTVTLRGLRDAAAPVLHLALRPAKGAQETVAHALPLRPAPGAPGRWHAEVPEAPALAEGRWDAFVCDAPGAPRQRVVPGVRDLRVLAGGAAAHAPGGRPLAVRLPYATKDGYFAVRAWLRPALAEAGELRVTAEGFAVRGRLFGAAAGLGGAAVLRLRGCGGATTAKVPLRDEGDGAFSFTAAWAALTPVPEPGPPAVWDVFVKPSLKARRVRVARLLDDVADKKAVFVYPDTEAGGVTFRPYYTLDNDLSVQVTPPSAEPPR